MTVGETKTLSIKKIPENTTDENPIIVEYAGHLDANRLEVSESGQIKAITRGTTDVLIRCGDYYMYYNIPVLDSEYPDLDLVWNIGGQHFMTKLDSSVNGTFYNIPIVDGKVYVKLCNKPYDLWCTGLPKESCGYIVLTNGGSGTGYAPDVVSSALNYLSDGVYITGFSPDKTFVDVYVRFSCSTNP